MKINEVEIDTQDLANYALALQGRDNGVEAYTLIERLDVLERLNSILCESDICYQSNTSTRYIRNEKQLVNIGEELEAWLKAKTGDSLDYLACGHIEKVISVAEFRVIMSDPDNTWRNENQGTFVFNRLEQPIARCILRNGQIRSFAISR